jgi:uncharacterized membrane protein YhaH (DUF805 family)
MRWFLMALKKYAEFSGRSRRKEYWFFLLFAVLISFVLAIMDVLTGSMNERAGVGLLSGIFSLAILIPSLALAVRRLHDTDRSAWWLLVGLVPLIGGIVLLVFCCQDGTPGSNRYGSNPKAVG